MLSNKPQNMWFKFTTLFIIIPLCYSLNINVLPSNTQVINYQCPTGYTGLCTNDVATGLYISLDGDNVITYGSYYYINGTNPHNYWFNDTYLVINKSITFYSNSSTVIELGGCGNESLVVGLLIIKDGVTLTKLNFTTQCIIRTMVYIGYNGTDLYSYSNGTNQTLIEPPTDPDRPDYQGPVKKTAYSNTTKNSLILEEFVSRYMKRDPVPINQPCSSCFCGCGKESEYSYMRYNTTITHCQFTANANYGLLSTGNWYGIAYLLFQFNVLIQLGDEDLYHIYINTSYVTDTALTYNNYGKCVYPRVVVLGCSSDEYIPYYIDDGLTLAAPLVDNSSVAYISLEEAITAGATTVFLRGSLYMDQSISVSTFLFQLSPSDSYACCATIYVPDYMNPAITSVYPNIQIQGITFSLGIQAGGIMFRNGAAQTTSELDIVYYPEAGIDVDAYTVLSNATVSTLLQQYWPSYVPQYPITTPIYDSQFISSYDTTDESNAYTYAILIFNMNGAIFENFIIQNTLIEGGVYGIINNHPTTSVIGSLIQCVHGIACNDSGLYQSNNIMVANSTVPNCIFTNTSTLISNQFICLGNSCYPTYPPDIASPSEGNQYIYQNSTDYVLYSSFDNRTSLGLAGIDDVTLSVVHLVTCDYVGRAIFIPNAVVPPFAAFNSVPSYYTIYSSFSLADHTVTMTRYKKDIGNLECESLVMYYGYSNGITSLWEIGGIAGLDSISSGAIRICGSINYTTEGAGHNTIYQLSYGPSAIYVCPTYNSTDTNHTRTLEDAIFISEPDSVIILCNDVHEVTSCLQIDKALEITNDGTDARPTVTCANGIDCCCIFNVTVNGGGTTISNISFTQSGGMYNGDDECCYPSAIQVGIDTTGILPYLASDYIGCTNGFNLVNSSISGFKNAVRIGCAVNVSIESNVIQDSLVGIVAITMTTDLLSDGTVWQNFIDNNAVASNSYFSIASNEFDNVMVSISNQDLYGSASTITCKYNALPNVNNFDVLWAPWSISSNSFNNTDLGITISSVSSFQNFYIELNSNNFTLSGSNLSFMPQPFYLMRLTSMYLNANGIKVFSNNIVNHDVILSSGDVEFYSNVMQGTNINVTGVNPYYPFNAGFGSLAWKRIYIHDNNLCDSHSNSSIYASILTPNIGSTGFNKVTLEKNVIPTLTKLHYATNNLGVPLNVDLVSTFNCIGKSIQPNANNKQYLLPNLTGYETNVFGTCPSQTIPSGDGLSCVSCTPVTIEYLVTVNVASTYCFVFSGGISPTTTSSTTHTTTTTGSEDLVSPDVLSWVIPLALVGGVILLTSVVTLATTVGYINRDKGPKKR